MTHRDFTVTHRDFTVTHRDFTVTHNDFTMTYQEDRGSEANTEPGERRREEKRAGRDGWQGLENGREEGGSEAGAGKATSRHKSTCNIIGFQATLCERILATTDDSFTHGFHQKCVLATTDDTLWAPPQPVVVHAPVTQLIMAQNPARPAQCH